MDWCGRNVIYRDELMRFAAYDEVDIRLASDARRPQQTSHTRPEEGGSACVWRAGRAGIEGLL